MYETMLFDTVCGGLQLFFDVSSRKLRANFMKWQITRGYTWRAGKFAVSVGLERICCGLGSPAWTYSRCWLTSFLVKLTLDWNYSKTTEFQNSFCQAPLFPRSTKFVWFWIWFQFGRSSTISVWFNFRFFKPEFSNLAPRIQSKFNL